MKRSTDTSRINPRDFDLFVGMDVDKRSISVAVWDWDSVVYEKKFPYDGTAILTRLQRKFRGANMAFTYETGPTGFGLYDTLTGLGQQCLLVPSHAIPERALERNKTNRIDANKLAENLRGGQLFSIRVPSTPYRKLRRLCHLLEAVVKRCVQSMNRIKSLFLFEGIPFPEGPSWTKACIEQLRTSDEYNSVRFEVNMYLGQLEAARNEKSEVESEIRRYIESVPELLEYAGYLMSFKGISWTIASALLSRIGDPSQLKNCRELGCFLGLTPWENSTGEGQDRSNVTGMGNHRVRSLLIEASWIAIQYDQELRDFYNHIRSRHPEDRAKKVAIVAVARKLTMRIYAVLKERRNYEIRTPKKAKPKSPKKAPPKPSPKARKRKTQTKKNESADSGKSEAELLAECRQRLEKITELEREIRARIKRSD
jgi:transposase